MNANELRIGNIINPKNKWIKYAKITGIYNNGNIKYDGGSRMIQKNVLDIDGINLDSEHIFRFGFSFNGAGFQKGKIEVFILESAISGELIFKISYDCNSIRLRKNYVHEFQNIIFALTGEELQYTQAGGV